VLSNEVDIPVKESFAVVFLYSEDHQLKVLLSFRVTFFLEFMLKFIGNHM